MKIDVEKMKTYKLKTLTTIIYLKHTLTRNVL